ncbi:hypothetical protein KAJ87_04075 [Candidatus Pacearchaeota archaeon]|nr:hypothetical protein [Candidatus Pacearchaeota archaeon]
MKQENHKGISALEGFVDGARLGVDPVGALYSSITNQKTFGGIGLRGIDFNDQKNKLADYNSRDYKGWKVFGAAVGFGAQISTLGGVQVFTLLADYVNYRNLKKQSNEKFQNC